MMLFAIYNMLVGICCIELGKSVQNKIFLFFGIVNICVPTLPCFISLLFLIFCRNWNEQLATMFMNVMEYCYSEQHKIRNIIIQIVNIVTVSSFFIYEIVKGSIIAFDSIVIGCVLLGGGSIFCIILLWYLHNNNTRVTPYEANIRNSNQQLRDEAPLPVIDNFFQSPRKTVFHIGCAEYILKCEWCDQAQQHTRTNNDADIQELNASECSKCVCCICLESMNQKVIVTLKCLHSFHAECFCKLVQEDQFKKQMTCILCRTSLLHSIEIVSS